MENICIFAVVIIIIVARLVYVEVVLRKAWRELKSKLISLTMLQVKMKCMTSSLETLSSPYPIRREKESDVQYARRCRMSVVTKVSEHVTLDDYNSEAKITVIKNV
jgi:hypothetical protein